jgi:hypothetical protein
LMPSSLWETNALPAPTTLIVCACIMLRPGISLWLLISIALRLHVLEHSSKQHCWRRTTQGRSYCTLSRKIIHCGTLLHWARSRHRAKCVQFSADLNIESNSRRGSGVADCDVPSFDRRGSRSSGGDEIWIHAVGTRIRTAFGWSSTEQERDSDGRAVHTILWKPSGI